MTDDESTNPASSGGLLPSIQENSDSASEGRFVVVVVVVVVFLVLGLGLVGWSSGCGCGCGCCEEEEGRFVVVVAWWGSLGGSVSPLSSFVSASCSRSCLFSCPCPCSCSCCGRWSWSCLAGVGSVLLWLSGGLCLFGSEGIVVDDGFSRLC